MPAAVKGLAALPVLYVVWPLDLLPDLMPILGQLDDVGVVLMVVEAFLALCPGDLVDHHRRALDEGRPFAPLAAAPLPPRTGRSSTPSGGGKRLPAGNMTGNITIAQKEPPPRT